jgi:hypothetical protein
LLGRSDPGRQRISPADCREGATAAALKSADSSAKLSVRFDEMEDRLTDRFTRYGIMQDRGTSGGNKGGDDAGGIRGAESCRVFASRDGKGELISARAVVIVGNLNEDKSAIKARKPRGIENLDGFYYLRFRAKPTLMWEIGDEELLENFRSRSPQQVFDPRYVQKWLGDVAGFSHSIFSALVANVLLLRYRMCSNVFGLLAGKRKNRENSNSDLPRQAHQDR